MTLLGIEVKVVNGEAVRQGLEDLSGEFIKVGRLRLFRIAQRMRKQIIKPPGRFKGRFEAATDEQANYIMWAARTGEISIPYKRKRKYAKSWTIDRTEDGYDLVGQGYWLKGTGMRVGYPPGMYIGGDIEGKNQSWVHQGRWALVADVVSQGLDEVPEELWKDLAVTAKNRGYRWE